MEYHIITELDAAGHKLALVEREGVYWLLIDECPVDASESLGGALALCRVARTVLTTFCKEQP